MSTSLGFQNVLGVIGVSPGKCHPPPSFTRPHAPFHAIDGRMLRSYALVAVIIMSHSLSESLVLLGVASVAVHVTPLLISVVVEFKRPTCV